jgi:hypothetical protein
MSHDTKVWVVTVAYKGSGKKAKIQGIGGPRSQRIQIGGSSPNLSNFGAPKSKKQSGSGGNSRKTHDTKGRNNHGRSSGYGGR